MIKLKGLRIARKDMVSISYSVNQKLEADQVYYFFKDNKVDILRDEFDVKYNESYDGFMERVAGSKYIIMILSQEFFHSRHCMYEAITALSREDYKKVIIPIIAMKQDIDSAEVRARLVRYWSDKLSKLEAAHKKIVKSSKSEHINKEIELYNNIINNLDDALKRLANIRGYELETSGLNIETVCEMVYRYIFKEEPKIHTVRKIEELVKHNQYEIFKINDDLIRINMSEFIYDLEKCSSFNVSLFPEYPFKEEVYYYIRHSIIESYFGPSLYITMYDINYKEITLGINDIKAVEFNNSFHDKNFFKYYIKITNREKVRDFQDQMRLSEEYRDSKKIGDSLKGMNPIYGFTLKFLEENAYEV